MNAFYKIRPWIIAYALCAVGIGAFIRHERNIGARNEATKSLKPAIVQAKKTAKSKSKKFVAAIAASDTAVEKYDSLAAHVLAGASDTSAVPVPVVKQLDSAAKKSNLACSVVKLTCAEANAAKDTVIAQQDSLIKVLNKQVGAGVSKSTAAIIVGGAIIATIIVDHVVLK